MKQEKENRSIGVTQSYEMLLFDAGVWRRNTSDWIGQRWSEWQGFARGLVEGMEQTSEDKDGVDLGCMYGGAEQTGSTGITRLGEGILLGLGGLLRQDVNGWIRTK